MGSSPACALGLLCAHQTSLPYSSPGGTCCGDACYAGLQFVLNGTALQSLLRPDTCVSAAPDGSTMGLAACKAGDPTQAFAYSPASGALSQGTKCLAGPPPPPPPVTYMAVCTRIGSYNSAARRARALAAPAETFVHAPAPGAPTAPGYCLSVDSTGAWHLYAGGSSLANGVIAPFTPTAPHALAVTAAGSSVSGSIDGSLLFNVSDSRYTSGFVALASSFTEGVAFDDFSVAPA